MYKPSHDTNSVPFEMFCRAFQRLNFGMSPSCAFEGILMNFHRASDALWLRMWGTHES
jgi:hypothetical protein